MDRREFGSLAGAATLVMATPLWAAPDYAAARDAFSAAAARTLKRKPSSFVISPQPGLEGSDYYGPLEFAGMFPWRITDAKLNTLLTGFSGGDPIRIAFEGYTPKSPETGPAGLGALFEAAGLFGRKTMKAEAIAARLMFCLSPDTGVLHTKSFERNYGWAPPASAKPASLKAGKTGAVLSFVWATQGNTGTFDFDQITVTVTPDFRYEITRSALS